MLVAIGKICKDCGAPFALVGRDLHRFTHEPERCEKCRARRKEANKKLEEVRV